jgi:hypothetical protein
MAPNRTVTSKKSRNASCLSFQSEITSALVEISPVEIGRVGTCIRDFFATKDFKEVVLGPFSAQPIDYLGHPLEIPGVGQLRFNTEPEIWASAKEAERFFSISNLFRQEKEITPLRRCSFFVVDFYQIGVPELVLEVFWAIVKELARAGFAKRLGQLRVDYAVYDPVIDGPSYSQTDARWVITSGYGPEHSFFEVNERGESTRREVFLVTPSGYLEIGVFGITGWNRNPEYRVRNANEQFPEPDLRRSGMCFGLERLLLAEQILAMKDRLKP